MSNAIQITPRLWQLKMGTVNAYLIPTDDGLILVDAGWPNKADVIFETVRESGHNPADIRHIVLTHGHIDHAGSAAEVQKRTGAKVYAHAADLSLITNGEAEHPNTKISPGILFHVLWFVFVRPGGTKYQPFSVDQTIKDGDTLSMAPDIEVIHSPGHCAGHVALLMRKEGVLIAGDICSNTMGLNYSIINENMALAKQSVLRVAEYPFDKAVFGHGDALMGNANQKLKEKFSAMKP